MARRKRSIWSRLMMAGLASSGVASALAWAAWARGQEPTAVDAGVNRTYLNKSLIHLPIEIEGNYRAQISNLVLYAKEGINGAWSIRDKAAPMQTSFTFRAPRDGEYWFRIVAIDNQGKAHPDDLSKDIQDSVVVIVDSVPPTLELTYRGSTPDGQFIHCDLRDTNPDSLKTRFYYQTRDQVWRNLDPVPNQPNVFCIPAQAALTNFIRVVSQDLAGNPVARTVSLSELANAAARTPQPTPAPLPQSIAQQPQLPAANPTPTAPVAAAPAPVNPAPVVDSRPAMQPGGRINQTPQAPAVLPTVAQGPSLETPATPAVIPGPAVLPEPVAAPQPVAVAATPAPTPVATPAPTPTTIYPAAASFQAPVSPAVNPAPAREIATTSGTLTRQPTSPPVQTVGSTQVFLNYAVENVGASGVGKMEIYATRDRGQSWTRVSEETQRKNPLEVVLPGEGTFGLKLIASNGRGFGGQPPQAGDPADWWVEVDTTKPRAAITGVRVGADQDTGSLHILWQCEDKNLSEAPIDLYFAPSREGPWTPIAKSLKNIGQHRWAPPVDAGAQTFIRLLARDKAGNVALSETTQPVPLDDQSRPRVRVLGLTASPTVYGAPTGIIPVQATDVPVGPTNAPTILPAHHATSSLGVEVR